METRHHIEGTELETLAGYARAVRRGGLIEVSGTTVAGDGRGGPDETRRQTAAALLRALDAVTALGGGLADVVRTRLFLAPAADWVAAAEAHAEVMGSVSPANTTMYVAGLIGDGAVVEVEVEAHVEDGSRDAAAPAR